jgi:hypothetical protein
MPAQKPSCAVFGGGGFMRVDRQRPLTARQRLVEALQLKERVGSIADRRHEAWVDRDRTVVIGKRFVKAQ